MTPWRLLLIIPAAAVLIVAGVPLLTPSLGAEGAARLVLTAAAAVGALGLFRAAGGLARGDYMRGAWLLVAASYALIAVEFPLPRALLPGGRAIGIVFVCAINVLNVAGMLRFSRAFAVSGLELVGARTRNRVIVAVAVLIAVALAGVPLYRSLRSVLAGDLAEIDAIVSSLGDLVLLACVAPLLLSALALRGGVLVWPWAVLTASSVAWLLYDTQTLVPLLAPAVSPAALAVWSNLWQGLACVLAGVAGLAQRRLSS